MTNMKSALFRGSIVIICAATACLWILRAQALHLFSIVSPQQGQQFHSGDAIQLTVAPTLGATLQGVEVVGPFDTWEDEFPPSTIPISIPAGYSGTATFHVYAESAGVWDSMYLTVNVVPEAQLQQLTVQPSVLQLVAPGTSIGLSTLTEDQLAVTGKYSDGITRDITQSSQTVFSSNNVAVATVSITGHVYAVAPGQTVINVSNSGMQASATIDVNIFPLRGDLNGDGDVDQNDLNAILKALNTSSTGQGDPRDLNNDGQINALDARILTTLCSRPHCATQK